MNDHRHVLAFMAHPDDIEILCAGTLIRLKNKGYQIHMATMTAGDAGSMELPNEEIARVRLEEAKASAKLLEATYHCAGEKDCLISYQASAIKKAIEILRLCQPFLVITHAPSDYMLDHEVTSQIVRNACFSAPAPNVKTDMTPAAKPLSATPYLYYASPMENRNMWGEVCRPDLLIDTTQVMELKEKMLECHASQREWLLKHHGVDEFVGSMRRWSAEIAVENMAYAEGFRQHRGHAYPHDDKLKELLGS